MKTSFLAIALGMLLTGSRAGAGDKEALPPGFYRRAKAGQPKEARLLLGTAFLEGKLMLTVEPGCIMTPVKIELQEPGKYLITRPDGEGMQSRAKAILGIKGNRFLIICTPTDVPNRPFELLKIEEVPEKAVGPKDGGKTAPAPLPPGKP